MDEEKTGLIYKQIPKIMADIEAIGKDRENTGQGYKFRGIDDVYNMIHSLLAKHKVFTVSTILDQHREEHISKSGSVSFTQIATIKYTFFAEDGSFVETIVLGEGMDWGDKASYKAMAGAHKYGILQMFVIPTEDPKDPENDNHELVSNADKKTKTEKKKPAELDAKAKESNAKLYKQLVDLINEMHKALIIDAEEKAKYLKKATSYRHNTGKLMEAIKKLKAQFQEAQKSRAKLDKAADEGFKETESEKELMY